MFQWTVIGAGPAGIAAVGKLLDNGINENAILWIDPAFHVGDFGTLWRNVPSNTKVKLFQKFLQASTAFNYAACPTDFALNHLEPEKTCYLELMADPLQWVTSHLQTRVKSIVAWVDQLTQASNGWNIHVNNEIISSQKVILATGAEPRYLSGYNTQVIHLSHAMDRQAIKEHLTSNDVVAVFGSSHSAILALRNLVENDAQRIINFYRSPLRYAIYYDDWILYDDTGLKGTTAEWARDNIDGRLPDNLERYPATDDNIQQYLPFCNKVIYAVGFAKREITMDTKPKDHTQHNGMIAPNLYGFGIAYPEAKHNPLGDLEHRVGLWKFMDYLQRVIPLWIKA